MTWTPVLSRQQNDCATVSIANVFDRSYEEVYAWISERAPGYPVDGCPAPLTVQAADHFYQLTYGEPHTVPGPSIPSAHTSGLLNVVRRGSRMRHLVALFNGMVLDTDGTVLPLSIFQQLRYPGVAWFMQTETCRKITAHVERHGR